MSTISGAYLSATIGNSTIEGVMGWKARETVARLDGQTGVHAGYTADDFGSKTLNVDLQLVMDITSTPYLLISPGTTITNLKLYRNATDTDPAFLVPTFKVFDADQGATVKDKFSITASGSSYGSYTANDPS